MINVLFDQYQRYNNARKIIDGLRVNNETFRILEVGANEHRNLEKFLPLDNITYLDIQLPEELVGQPNYILGDATNMSFSNNEYDVIVALDVFEHIPSDKRNQFIDELYRVSSKICIITAPFHSQQTVAAESRVNTVYKSLFNKNFIWLEEHMENGLPNKDSLRDYLKTRNINFKMIGHGNIDLWERLMTIHFFAAKNPELGLYREEIDKFYNSNIFDYDYTDDSYRMVVILEKGGNSPVIKNSTKGIPLKVLEELNFMERTFFHLKSMLDTQYEIDYSDKIQLFIDTGKGFNEIESENFQVNKNELINLISADLDNYGDIYSIRIDPSRYCGVFKVKMLCFNDIGHNQIMDYKITGNFGIQIEDQDLYLFKNDDPNIVLNLNEKKRVSRVEFVVCKLTETEIINLVISTLIIKEKELTSITTKYANQTMVNESFDRKLNEKDKLLKNKNQLIDKLSSENKSIHEEYVNKLEEIKFNNKLYLDKLKNEVHFLSKDNNKKELELKKSLENLKDLDNERQELVSLIKSKEQELKAIYESKAWKVVVNLRKVIGK